jgi:RimJ/RimL family protein N-acetyltransferase
LIRPLLAPSDPGDALAAYYALRHDDRRVQLTLHTVPGGQTDGFVAVCQTGRDLFVPLVILRAPAQAVGGLLRRALHPGRPYTLITTPALCDEVEQSMRLDWGRLNFVYRYEPSAYRSRINVMVQPGQGPFRFEIRSGDRVVSAAGVNWQSERLAEMYVYTDPEVQGRGWGRAVGAACVSALLKKDILPLYTVAEDNVASKRLAQALGFRDSGAREYECRGQLRA